MGDIKKLFGVDKKKEVDGVWEDITEDVRVKIARMGNPNYQKEIARLMKPHRRAVRRGTVDDSVIEKCVTQAMARTVLLDWEGIEEDGKKVLYSFDEARRLLTEYKEFRDQVSEIASELETFQDNEDEETVKNLKMSSAGTSKSGTN